MIEDTYLSIDFETRSTIDLRKSGVHRYAEDPTTDIWCMAYAVRGTEPKLWLPGDPVPPVVPAAAERGVPFRAWNAPFEEAIWDILATRYGFPGVPLEQWIDTAAEASVLGLPRSLDGAAEVLGLAAQKDSEGRKLMLKMMKPRAVGAWWIHQQSEEPVGPFATKAEAETWRKEAGLKPKEVTHFKDDTTILWWDDDELIQRLGQYCMQDVRTEMEASESMADLWLPERRIYLLTQRMNQRGIYVDTDLVTGAKAMVASATEDFNQELQRITEGAVTAVSEPQRIRAWVNDHSDLALEDLRKDTVRDILNDRAHHPGVPDDVWRALEIRQDAGKTSLGKLDAFFHCMGSDGRIRDLLQHYGAHTGRWAGRLLQPQNFPRPEGSIARMVDEIVVLILRRDYEGLRRLTGMAIPTVIVSMLRSMLIAAPGHVLFGGDYSQIEARVVAWLAGQDDLVQLFREGGKVYETMAAFIFSLTVEEIAKDSFERQIGKNSVLGCGFQMGPDRFAEQVQEQTGIILDRGWGWHCSGCGTVVDELDKPEGRHCKGEEWTKIQLREDMAAKAVYGYRTLYSRIKDYWPLLESAAISAVQNPEAWYYVQTTEGGPRVGYIQMAQFLYCRLPSGRTLAYAMPHLRWRNLPEPYEDEQKLTLHYYTNYNGSLVRTHTYGGKLTENVVQAVARDVMAEGMLRLEAHDFHPILTVHDEVVCEEPQGTRSLDEYMSHMTHIPSWADGLPVAAEGWVGRRYQK